MNEIEVEVVLTQENISNTSEESVTIMSEK